MCQIDVNTKYANELHDIYHKLDDLKNSRVFELSNNEADPKLADVAGEIEHMIRHLMVHIERD